MERVLEELMEELAVIAGPDRVYPHMCGALTEGCPRCLRDDVYDALERARGQMAKVKLGVAK